MNWLDSFLNPEKGYEKGQDQLDKYFQQGQGYLQPYNQFGQDAHSNLSEAMKRLLNPEGLQADWIKSYNESPAALNAASIAKENGLDAASSMGLMGSNTALNALQGGASKIALDDRQNYLNDLMQKYLAGANIGNNIFNTGANSANSMSQNSMNMGNHSAQMAFGRQNAPGDLFGKLLGTGIGAVSGGLNYTNPTGSGWSFGGK